MHRRVGEPNVKNSSFSAQVPMGMSLQAFRFPPIESTMTSVARLSIVGLAMDGGDIIVCIYIYKEPAMRRRIICVS